MDASHTNSAGIDTNTTAWLWTTSNVMFFSCVIIWFWVLSVRPLFLLVVRFLIIHPQPRMNRIFRVVPVISLGVTTLSYLLMASNLGWVTVSSECESHATRLVSVCPHSSL